MKKHILLFALLSASCSLALADVSPQNAYKAMLELFTYDSGGKLLQSGPAFFVDAQGQAAASYTLLQGASRAEVIDYKGKKYPVIRISGANAATDLVKFRIEADRSKDFFSIVSAPVGKECSLQLVQYANGKKAAKPNRGVSISSDEAYNAYRYYHTTAPNETAFFGCPLIDNTGKLVAIVQRNVEKGAATSCAIDARFINDLSITSTSALNADLSAIAIPKALPDNAKDALTYLYMLPQTDSLSCHTAYNDFVSRWPQMPDGYASRAGWYASQGNYAACEADFATAFDKARTETDSTSLKTDALHYNLSNLIYQTLLQRTDTVAPYQGWTFERAEKEADQAYAAAPYTLYLMQKGNCQFARHHYGEAAQTYQKACEDKNFASPATYFSAARSLELAGGDSTRVLALLDSCVAHVQKPVSAQDAQYYLERSQRLLRAQRYRAAVLDYNEYEKAVGPKNLSAEFYYLREQAEMPARMYQQALDDIRTAIATSTDPAPYRLEEASILLRVGEFQQAADAAAKLAAEFPDNADCYKILGIAQGELGHKAQALENLEKAKKMGDDSVDTFIKKYK